MRSEHHKKKVLECIEDGMKAGNFILSGDGEISYYTGLATLRTIVNTARSSAVEKE